MLAFFVVQTEDRRPMPRKPNYAFERREREKSKAQKKAERQRAKQEKAAQTSEGGEVAASDAPAETNTGLQDA